MGAEKEKNLEKTRQKIDSIDSGIVKLLDERAQLIKELGQKKKETGFSVYDPAREKKVIDQVAGESKRKGFPAEGIKDVFEEIFTHSRLLQEPLKIAFLGPANTFTHMAAIKKFGKQARLIAKDSIKEVFNAIEKKEVDYGVVPVENSTEGTVSNTLDMFLYADLNIVAEILLEVRHHLISKYDLKDIRKIYSRRIALAQCKDWIFRNQPKAELIEVSSTAKGAELAAVYLNSAAIASELAAKENKLNIIARNIEDNPNNITRFLVIGKTNPKRTGKDKTSIMFSVKHEAGALFKALKPLHELNINMTKIESRPTRLKTWEYVFFIDMEGFVEDNKVSQVLKEMENICSFVKVLGSYPMEERE